MKIALIGTRGVPANYGGFETCAEELGVALAEKGHEVIAYCRPGNAEGNPEEYKGVKLVYRPFINSKSLGTLSHTANSLIHAVRQDYDVLMVFNAGNAPLCVIPRLLRKRVAINVDGLEWKRAKWGKAAKLYYQFGEWAATKLANRIVSDSRAIQDYYIERYKTPSTFIAYGAHVEASQRPVDSRGVRARPDELLLRRQPARTGEPRRHHDRGVREGRHRQVAGDRRRRELGQPVRRRLRRRKRSAVKLLGPVYTPGHIHELHAHCYAYVHGNEVGGTNPALLKALGYGNCVLAARRGVQRRSRRPTPPCSTGRTRPTSREDAAARRRSRLGHSLPATSRRSGCGRPTSGPWSATTTSALFRGWSNGYYTRSRRRRLTEHRHEEAETCAEDRLVTGGAGFIGAHLARRCSIAGDDVVVLDDLSGGFADNVDQRATFVEGSITDHELVDDLFAARAVRLRLPSRGVRGRGPEPLHQAVQLHEQRDRQRQPDQRAR